MTELSLNNVKSGLSVAYIRAITAKCNFAFEESSREHDGVGIDCRILNFNSDTKPDFIPPPTCEIKVQLKSFSRSSTSMFRETDETLEYRLTKRLIPVGVLFYLIVMELPEEENIDSWLKVDLDQLVLKKCVYYQRIHEIVEPGFVSIPKKQLLTDLSLPKLFITKPDFENYI